MKHLSFFILLVGAAVLLTLSGSAGAHSLTRTTSYIASVEPAPGSVTDQAMITITFNRAMNPATLNRQHIEITSEKQARNVTDAFEVTYQPDQRLLVLKPKDPGFNFGTGNVVKIAVKGTVEDVTGKRMGRDFTWSFRT